MDACERIDTKKKLHKWEILLARCEETISGDDFAAFFFFFFLWTEEVKSGVIL